MDRSKRLKRNSSPTNQNTRPRPNKEIRPPLTLKVKMDQNLPFPFYREPKQIGFYSLDDNRSFQPNASQMKFFYAPRDSGNVNFDLNTGYANAVRKEFGKDAGLDGILQWILTNKNMLLMKNGDRGCQETLQTDFVCYRGLLSKIMATPYENQEDWIICATKHKGTIYLCGFKTEREHERHAQETERDRLMSAWGYKFEQYMMSDKPGVSPNTEIPVNEKSEYNVVVRTRLKNHSLIFGAEVDGIKGSDNAYPQKTGKVDKYIELKTSRVITHPRQHRTFCRFKILKWWCQSYLIGIPKIYCGFRDDNGIVETVDEFDTQSLPKMGQEFWSPSFCMNFCETFLTFVKTSVTEDNPKFVYKFNWKPGQNVTCELLTEAGQFEILKPWFIEKF